MVAAASSTLRAQPSLLGVDVGFAKDARSTGLAWRVDGVIGACRTGSAWSARSLSLPAGVTFDLAALDAPLVPAGPGIPIRGCEAAFYRGAFWNRCRPGMSHHGRGLELRRAGEIASAQFTAVLRDKEISAGAAVPGVPMVEAFPNTFLGVLLPERVRAVHQDQGRKVGLAVRGMPRRGGVCPAGQSARLAAGGDGRSAGL